jgi:hypothetical protein
MEGRKEGISRLLIIMPADQVGWLNRQISRYLYSIPIPPTKQPTMITTTTFSENEEEEVDRRG